VVYNQAQHEQDNLRRISAIRHIRLPVNNSIMVANVVISDVTG
jgi:hypothetical protein